jgi:hypothetical protein
MTRLAMSDLGAEYSRIFGPREDASAPGRQRLCKHCGDWHYLARWPHNCRDEAPPRAPLAAPQIAPSFDAFMPGRTGEAAVIINDRRQKRDFMERHELVEYEESLPPPPEPTERQWVEEFAADLTQVMEADPLNRPPVDVIGRTDLEGADEIDTTAIEVFE